MSLVPERHRPLFVRPVMLLCMMCLVSLFQRGSFGWVSPYAESTFRALHPGSKCDLLVKQSDIMHTRYSSNSYIVPVESPVNP